MVISLVGRMENYAKRELNDVIENRFAVNEMEI